MDKKLIVLISNNLRYREIVKDILEYEDYAVVGTDSSAGFNLITRDCSAVILNWESRVVNDVDIFKQIRKYYPSLPVIITSSERIKIPEVFRSARDGAFDFMQEPIDLHYFLLQVSNAVNEGFSNT